MARDIEPQPDRFGEAFVVYRLTTRVVKPVSEGAH